MHNPEIKLTPTFVSRTLSLHHPLSQVTLAPGSRLATIFDRNTDFLLNLNSTRLMCLYTSAANITGTFARPTCNAYGHPQYYGHYLGHWLSATAMVVEVSGSAAAVAKNAEIVKGIAAVQDAWTGIGMAGYVFPYSIVSWANLFGNPSRNCDPVCVPFYVYHKMLQVRKNSSCTPTK